MIKRILGNTIKKTAKTMPMIGILGPRQSGKTTLARTIFPDYTYVNLEQPENMRLAEDDPIKFLEKYSQYAILAEVQRVPHLFSYLQVKTDEDKIDGQYILTGSQHFLMLSSITQSLAGRIALFNLYPLSHEELITAKLNYSNLYDQIWHGGYPRLYEPKADPKIWLGSYIQSYLERDVSLLSTIDNLKLFDNFLHLLAGRTGQILNLSTLASDIGISHNTIKSWVHLLEISGLIKLLEPYYVNLNKRLTKTPKIYFLDTGLVCRLLGINSPNELSTHPLIGAIFETWIVSETLKYLSNHQDIAKPDFWRDRTGLEADLLLERGSNISLFEIKSAHTPPADYLGKLEHIQTHLPKPSSLNLIYGGKETHSRTGGNLISWHELHTHLS